MMKQRLGFLLLGAATVACSGRYYEVGDMGGVAGSSAGNGGPAGGATSVGNATAGTSSTIDPGVGAAPGTGDAGPATPVGQCVPKAAPAALTGAFADSTTVWRRIATLVSGPPASAPTKPPTATTTYAWAGKQVTVQVQAAKQSLATLPGAELFLRRALGLAADAPFQQQWGVLLSTQNGMLNALLRAPLRDSGRVGIFSEPSWLAQRTTISSRGAGIEDFLFGRPIPSPPEGIENPKPNPDWSDRVNLEVAVASNAPCTGCHRLMDPTGFALGNFAADGSYRELDHGLPVDTASSRSSGMPEQVVEFDGIGDFGAKFEGNCEALQGIAHSFLRAAISLNGSPESAGYDVFDESVERVQLAFINSNRTYEDLVRAYIQSPAGLRP